MTEFSKDPFEQSNLDDQSMSALLQQARAGDSDSRGKLMAHLQKYLAFVAYHQMDGNLQAKMGPSDVVQQSMVQAIENLGKFKGNTLDEFRAWIRQILVNEAKQMKRDLHAQKRDIARERSLADGASGPQRFDLVDSLPTPGTNATTEEQTKAVASALEKLPQQERQIIQWRNWDGLSFEEIGRRLDMSTSTASRYWYRALMEFKKYLVDDHE